MFLLLLFHDLLLLLEVAFYNLVLVFDMLEQQGRKVFVGRRSNKIGCGIQVPDKYLCTVLEKTPLHKTSLLPAHRRLVATVAVGVIMVDVVTRLVRVIVAITSMALDPFSFLVFLKACASDSGSY